MGLVFFALLIGLFPRRVLAGTGSFTIVLDAGHGGEDPGALDTSGTIYEADVSQRVTDELARLLQMDSRFHVVLTHQPGSNPGINERAATATQASADLLVSLHLNANIDDFSARGFQLFPVLPHNPYSAESMEAAKQIASRMREAGATPLDGDGIYYAMYLGQEAKQFFLASEHAAGLPFQGQTYGVVEYAETPALLIEQWFITNEEDMQQFNNDDGISRMAHALYQGIADYAGQAG